MTMLLVVPVEELLAEGAAVLDAAESVRERAIFQVRNWLSEYGLSSET
jgi:hypothetical protein